VSDCICPDYPRGVHASCPVHPDGARNLILGLAGVTTAAADQAQAMTDAELAERLLTGRWTTIEVHEAGRRLASRDSRSHSRPGKDGG
jgi:hypothetical protein